MVAYTVPASVDRHRRPDGRPLRVALVGFGYWGPNYARVLNDLPGVELTVVCDRSAERLAHVRARYPGDYDLRRPSPDVLAGDRVDAVVIATPASTHQQLVQAALESGHHVLVEKPMALDVAGCDELCDLAAASGRVLMVGYTFLYNAGVRKMKECMASDQFGQVYYLHATAHESRADPAGRQRRLGSGAARRRHLQLPPRRRARVGLGDWHARAQDVARRHRLCHARLSATASSATFT